MFTLDLLADVNGTNADVEVVGECYVGVRHCLVGYSSTPSSPSNPKERIANGEANSDHSNSEERNDKPGTLAPSANHFSHITKLYSHPQAWGQCNKFLNEHFTGVERQDVSSTSRAAQIAAEDKSGSSAALSSAVAASLFNLDVLAEGINDKIGNTTRFLIIKKRSEGQSPTAGIKAQGKWKSLVTFTVEHDNPGALAHCLAAFETHGINLTSINTRPSGQRNWHYIFFVEFEGRVKRGERVERDHGDSAGGIGDSGDRKEVESEEANVDKALKELGKVARGWKWIGSWEDRLGGA